MCLLAADCKIKNIERIVFKLYSLNFEFILQNLTAGRFMMNLKEESTFIGKHECKDPCMLQRMVKIHVHIAASDVWGGGDPTIW